MTSASSMGTLPVVLPPLGLDGIVLRKGAHSNRNKGVCAMEAVAWLAGESHSDHPACTSRVLGAFLRAWNDALDDKGRQKLKPYLLRSIGTAGDGHDEARAWLCGDWLVRVCAPAWLELAGVVESPAALRALAPILNTKAAREAQPTITKSRKAARAASAAAWAAARDAASAAAGDAARDAARDAAGDAAWAAAWAAAGAAGGAAAWAAGGAAAGDAARDAARAAAGDAAWAAAGDAAWAAASAAARDAAWAAAGDAARDAARDAAWAAARDAAWAAARDAAGDAAGAAAGDAAWAAASAAAGDAAWAAAGDAAGAAAGKKLQPTVTELQASALVLLDQLVSMK
jgi:hypothetical protein